MFTVTKQSQIEPIYVLNDTRSQSSLTVFPDRGGIATSWRVGDRELLYLDAERFTDPKLSVRGGIPILFPICGNLPDNTYSIGDKQYALKQHGFARELPWQVVSQSTDTDASLTVVLESNDQTRQVYPFDFSVSFTYRLAGGDLIIDQTYTNKSATPMPFSTGLHPYFAAPAKDRLTFEIPADSYQEKQTGETHAFAGKFDFSQAEIDAAFTDVKANVAIVRDAGQQLTLTMASSPNYRTVVFWTVADKDFYCLEPWTAPRNSLNTGKDLLHVAPGETLNCKITFSAKFA
ncbi:aldose epimerase [Chamaesiphon sp. OTE_20_metabat_361]|uniref:aldose epimerase family protein n=1 Tax=Chamaesiphon sp. OTE_20_metabat_361 TaxID=2964689 RepID=UPI00286D5075|nr:aldose epimerase [Chamaesiphon sp. OTE_20_metabat_361]